ncbi:protein with 4 transmembrane domains, signal peptide and a RING domain [Cryptosporidium felis]|nr:protein with 4 transmembrane domains, signal peptide and a RING domain [Cryptosporidium felis]
MRNENENQGNNSVDQKLTVKKHILRALLIFIVIIPLTLEIYFLVPNFTAYYLAKKWVRVSIRENSPKLIGKSYSEESHGYNKTGRDMENDTVIMLVSDPWDKIIGKNWSPIKQERIGYLRKKFVENSFEDKFLNKLRSKTNDYDRLLIKKDECDCSLLSNLSLDMFEDNGNWYSLKLDGDNPVAGQIYIQTISVIILLLRWSFVFTYIGIQLLLPIKWVRKVVNNNLLKSSIVSIFYISSSSLSLSFLGIQGKDCIDWWFLGSSPEYVLNSQIFVWLISCICLLLYLTQCLLESTFNISTRHKLINDFITSFIYIPLGLIIVISVTLCILGIIKPWIFMIWVTVTFIELEKNVRILAKLHGNFELSQEAVNLNSNNNSNNWGFFQLRARNNTPHSEMNNEINVTEMIEDSITAPATNLNTNSNFVMNEDNNGIVIIPISNSYFKILDSRFENFSTKICLWYINRQKEMMNNIFSRPELRENNDTTLELFEFSLFDLISKNRDNFEDELIHKSNSSVSTKAPSDPTFSRLSSIFTDDNISDDSSGKLYICNICFLDFDSIAIFSPCGHGNVCIECLGDYISNSIRQKQHPKCHICREEISKVLELKKVGENANEHYYSEKTDGIENNAYNKVNISNINDKKETKLISNAKVIAEIAYSARNQIHNTNGNRSSYLITVRISRRNSNLWSHPQIREFTNSNRRESFNDWAYNGITRFFSSRRSFINS